MGADQHGPGPGSDGRWYERANSLRADFAARADATVLGSLGFDSGHVLSFGLAGAAPSAGLVSGPSVTYPAVLPGTDLAESATSTGIRESLLLRSAAVPATWVFPLRLKGLTPVLTSAGAVDLVTAAGQVAGVIPHGSARDSRIDPRSGNPAETNAVTYRLVTYQGGPALQASLDKAWLASSARVFPVTVDPSAQENATGASYVMVGSSNVNNSQQNVMPVGTYDSGSDAGRPYLQFSNFGSDLANQHITSAALHVFDAYAWTCQYSETVAVYPVTQSWSLTSMSWPGPSIGSELGRLNQTASAAACGNSSADPSVGSWWTIGLSTDTFNSWTLGTAANYGLALRASETDNLAWKKFDGHNSPNPPYLLVDYSDDVAPQINSQYPPDNYNATSLTPELLASGSDPDSWPNPVKYDFTVENSAGTKVADSGLISSGEWTVPKGDLSWAQTYYWTVQDYDGVDYSGTPQISYFSTPVPQPLVTSGLSQNTGGQGFDAATGNYTTSATDAQVPATGPALSVQRDYNSLDPRVGGAFGAGWSSLLDMKAAPGQADSSGAMQTVVVTYPDGQQVGFGENSNGTTFTPPQGRFATFALVSGGGYKLTDKNDTVYTLPRAWARERTGSPPSPTRSAMR